LRTPIGAVIKGGEFFYYRSSAMVRSSGVETSNLPAVAFQLFQRVKLFSLFSKHIGFSEEAEWRVVYLRDRDATGPMVPMFDYRVGSRGIEPSMGFPTDD
jgi:hypothetical protein